MAKINVVVTAISQNGNQRAVRFNATEIQPDQTLWKEMAPVAAFQIGFDNTESNTLFQMDGEYEITITPKQ